MSSIETACAEWRRDRQIELVREHWKAARHLWLDNADPLKVAQLGPDLPFDFWMTAGQPGLGNIRPTRDGRFDFAEDGRRALIIPNYHVIPGALDANPAAHAEHLVDLVAVDLDRPGRFWRRRGRAVVLGNAYLEIASQESEAIAVFSTPLSWLRSGGAGICVLDWGWARDLLLDHELVAEDLALGTRLEAALRPHILVMEAA